MPDLTLATLQEYVNKRAKDGVAAATIRKKVATLRAAWNWSEPMGLTSGRFPNRGLRYPKADEKPPFMTMAEKVHFAIALLMTDNLPGCIQTLREIQEKDHPNVQRLGNAIRQWAKELSLGEKIQWHLGGQPARRVRSDCPHGEH